MKTPIFDFAREYAQRNAVRLHMPGHKGVSFIGAEKYDITEFYGADELYSPSGIIAESEENATHLFGTAHSFYSTEGASLAIKAMLALAVKGKRKPKILASRASHKSLLYAAALLDFDIEWIYPVCGSHIADSSVSADAVDAALARERSICAVFLTSPDYLGGTVDIESVAEVTRRYGVPLLVDNAHGAYLAFLEPSRHPIALGADMCCDSAHKTLPCLTGGAYLHISGTAPKEYVLGARKALSVFASTSPSYLILESLDLCNAYIADGYAERLAATVRRIENIKSKISALGYKVLDTEPLKIVIEASDYGYTGEVLAQVLRQNNIEIEFFDSEYLVFMLTPENGERDYEILIRALASVPRREPIKIRAASLVPCERRMSVREAIFADCETVPVECALGRISAAPAVSCPPAIPIVVSGEVIDECVIELFRRYNIDTVEVVKND